MTPRMHRYAYRIAALDCRPALQTIGSVFIYLPFWQTSGLAIPALSRMRNRAFATSAAKTPVEAPWDKSGARPHVPILSGACVRCRPLCRAAMSFSIDRTPSTYAASTKLLSHGKRQLITSCVAWSIGLSEHEGT